MTFARASLRSLAGVAALAACVSLPPIMAQAQNPGAEPGLHLTLDYDGRLYIKVMELHLQQDAAGRGFTSSARLTTYGVLALFRKLDLRAEGKGRLTEAGPAPGFFANFNASRKKPRRVTASWTGGDVVSAAEPNFVDWGDPVPTRAQRLEGADPLTQALRLSLTPADGTPCRGVLRFFDGKQRYDVTLSPAGARELEGREIKLGLTAPVKCRVIYREIAGFKRKSDPERVAPLQKPVLMNFARMGAAGPWVISSVRGDTPLGQAEITLQRISGQAKRP